MIEESFSTWDVVFLCEADRVASSSFCVEHPRHRVIRYWPGDGSFAFAFVVHQRLASVPLHVFGQNRACLLELRSSDHRSSTSLSIVGVHGPHSHYREFLSDLSQVLSERKCSGPCACVGDWNVNLANSRFCDFPCVLESDRTRLREDEEYSDFVGFVTESFFEVSCAREVAGTPDSFAWRVACTNCPYTRVPLGAQLGSPSVLDFGVGSRGVFVMSRDLGNVVLVIMRSCPMWLLASSRLCDDLLVIFGVVIEQGPWLMLALFGLACLTSVVQTVYKFSLTLCTRLGMSSRFLVPPAPAVRTVCPSLCNSCTIASTHVPHF